MTIVSIRGTHGSGKSTVVTTLMSQFPVQPIPGPKKRPTGYVVDLPLNRHLYIPGPYDTACGGCDAIQPYSDIIPRLQWALDQGFDVLFEGALVSSSYGTIGEFMNEQHNPVFAFLDTPLGLCLSRIALRRAKRWAEAGKPGSPPPVDPKNTSVKYDNVLRTHHQMDKLGSVIRRVDIDHTRAVKQVVELFGLKMAREPKPGGKIKMAKEPM